MKLTPFIIGILFMAMGLLWIGQGLGYIEWPAQSFMIREREWSYYGTALALAGLFIILKARK